MAVLKTPESPQPKGGSLKLKVTDGYQINHGGKIHQGGDTLENVNSADSARYLAAGWAEEAKESSKESKTDDSKSSPKKTTSKGDA